MKIIFAGMFVVVLGCVFLIRQSGYNPKPILVMKASSYESEEILGKSLLKRFYLEAKEIKNFIIICDFNPCPQEVIWNSFLLESQKNKLPARKYISYVHNLVDNKSSLKNKVLNEVSSEGYTFQIIPKGIDEFPEMENTIIFYMSHLFINKSLEPTGVDMNCSEIKSFTNRECLSLSYSRRFYRKMKDASKSYIGVEKISYNKYILLSLIHI